MPQPDVWGFDADHARTLKQIATAQGLRGENRLFDTTNPLRYKYLCYLAKSVGTISARVDETPGQGTVTIQWLNPATGKIEPYSPEGIDQKRKVYSFVAETSGTSVYVWVGYDAFGTLWYLNEACEDV